MVKVVKLYCVCYCFSPVLSITTSSTFCIWREKQHQNIKVVLMLYARFKNIKYQNFMKFPLCQCLYFLSYIFIYLSSRSLFQSSDFTLLDNQKFGNICFSGFELINLIYLHATSNDLSIIFEGVLQTSKYQLTEALYFFHDII